VSVDLNKKLKVTIEMPLSQDLGQQFAALSTVRVDAELGGQLNAGYLGNNISLDGDVEFARGDIESFGRSFTIDDSSVVHFTGTNYANPNLEMAARYITSSYGDVVMNVGGTALSPTFGLKSENTDVSYDETDLFAILLLGKPASAMADSEGESNSALMSAALSQVTGSVGSALSGTLVDEVDWDPDSGVRVGKAINDKLFLSYDWNNDPEEGENRNQVTLEWLISRRAFAEFVTGDEAQSSAELYWRVLFGEQVSTPKSSTAEPGEE
jgi:autotransporter translocation and assembly factor TamB